MRTQIDRMLDDKDGDGRPDLFDPPNTQVVETLQERFVIDGKEYTSRDQLPPGVRRLLEGSSAIRSAEQTRGIMITPGAALILGAILLTAVALVVWMLT